METPKKLIGYKATYNKVAKHNNFRYEVGQTYVHEEDIILCASGFHFCNKMEDVLHYYNPTHDFVLLEVEILSNNILNSGNKSVTDKLKVLRVIPLEEHKLYSVHDKLIIYTLNGKSYLVEYDSYKNRIYYNCNGLEWWKEYDAHGRQIYHKTISGIEWYMEYNPDGSHIWYNNKTKSKVLSKFDNQYRCTYFVNPTSGEEFWYSYDEDGNRIDHTSFEDYKKASSSVKP